MAMWRDTHWACGVNTHAHSIQLAAALLRFWGLRIALHQSPQFTDPGILLSHLNQRLSLAQFGGWGFWITGILLENRIVIFYRRRILALAVVDLTQIKLRISRERILRIITDHILNSEDAMLYLAEL